MRGVAEESWTQPQSGDEKLFVRFAMQPVQDDKKSQESGRPVFNDVEYIEIMAPGDRSNIVHRPVRDDDKQRFARQWAAWKSGAGEGVSGTPLKEWPGVTRGQVEELAHFRVHTVEQLAGISDGNMQNVGPLMALRQRARDYLEQAKGQAPLTQMRAELAQRDNVIETLQRQVRELGELVAKQEKSKGK